MKDLYGKKEKHDHKFSNLLKGCILAIVMLAPFFAILSKIVYVSVNKNAKDSYSGETTYEITYKYESNELNTNDDLVENNIYELDLTENKFNVIPNIDSWLSFKLITNITFTGRTSSVEGDYVMSPFVATYIMQMSNIDDIVYIDTYSNINQYSNGDYYTRIELDDNFEYTNKFIIQYIDSYDIDLNYISKTNYNEIESVNIDNTGTLDNAFYYAIEQSKDEEILNWTKDTPIYNVINTMNTGLGLSTNHILTYLLTYWSIILAIYIVFDIIIFIFTKITHYLQ